LIAFALLTAIYNFSRTETAKGGIGLIQCLLKISKEILKGGLLLVWKELTPGTFSTSEWAEVQGPAKLRYIHIYVPCSYGRTSDLCDNQLPMVGVLDIFEDSKGLEGRGETFVTISTLCLCCLRLMRSLKRMQNFPECCMTSSEMWNSLPGLLESTSGWL